MEMWLVGKHERGESLIDYKSCFLTRRDRRLAEVPADG